LFQIAERMQWKAIKFFNDLNEDIKRNNLIKGGCHKNRTSEIQSERLNVTKLQKTRIEIKNSAKSVFIIDYKLE